MARQLQRELPKEKVRLMRTKYAGHAKKLAYELARTSQRPLIISASGDGGYHEVVNGAMQAQLQGATPTTGLLPAGNANDHYHDTHSIDVAQAITQGKTQQVDLLTVSSTVDGKPFKRYAHSYIGFGLTPKVGNELNKIDLNWFNEIWIVTKVLFVLRPIRILTGNKHETYDSLIFSNISKMSKILSLSKNASNNDGKFEVTTFKRRNKLRLIKLLIKASTSGLSGVQRSEPFTFKTIKKVLVQADGEIATIDAQAQVTIDIEPKVLRCIV